MQNIQKKKKKYWKFMSASMITIALQAPFLVNNC